MYTISSNDNLLTNCITASTNRRGGATGGFVNARWRGNDLIQTATSSELVSKFSIAYSLDDDRITYGRYSEA